jgi:AcrR family transcriptional regulator
VAAVVRARDAEATRERILDAALTEFSAAGFAGARIHSIAKRAGVNVRMLYHYFGEKEDLFRAILRRRFTERPVHPSADPLPIETAMAEWFARVSANPDWARLSVWEALETRDGPVVEDEERTIRWRTAAARLRAQQADGRLAQDLDPELLLVALAALTTFPVVSSPMVRMITGLSPTDPAFRGRYTEFLGRLSAHLACQESEQACAAETVSRRGSSS